MIGRDYWGQLPSAALPNGLVAAYWDDLWCRKAQNCALLTGVGVGRLGGGGWPGVFVGDTGQTLGTLWRFW